ncbi:MAG TPA: Hpt domain-containing protein [Burkholderiaceae bacterium]|nr:Hpt domain-containing protein [Burkholderiaceae bacterium]
MSRLSFWLAAALAAVALFAPHGRETPLTLSAAATSLLALVFWRCGLRRRPEPPARPVPAAVTLLDEPALRDAHVHVARAVQQAASFEAALHAVGRVLRGELGARGSEVQWVLGVEGTHALLSGLIESQPGFRTVPRRLRLDASPLGQALATRRPAGAAPGALALPIVAGDALLATIELSGLELAIEPAALASLLELAQSGLAVRALAPAAPEPPTIRPIDARDIGDNAAVSDDVVALRLPGGCNGARASGMLDDCVHPQGFDDLLVPPMRAQGPAAMLSRPSRLHTPAEAGDAAAPGASGAPPALNAAAIARLRELDPDGKNLLIERVLTAFRTSVARLQPQLDAARASGDVSTLRLVAHTLKSSSASIGALHLSALCAQTEAAIRQDATGADLNPGLDALVAAIADALRAIDVQLKERA